MTRTDRVAINEMLIASAWTAHARAYAPYSSFGVGAALLTMSGEIFMGCNVENLSLGLTMCAERVAVGTAVAQGEKQFELLVVASDSQEPVVPCGACRQVLAEFNPGLRIISVNRASSAEFHLRTLLPVPAQGILG